MSKTTVTRLLPGDGIGPDVAPPASVLDAAGAEIEWEARTRAVPSAESLAKSLCRPSARVDPPQPPGAEGPITTEVGTVSIDQRQRSAGARALRANTAAPRAAGIASQPL